MMHSAPTLWHGLMTKLCGVTAAFLKAQAKAGAQALQLFDSWAGALSRQDYTRFAAPYSRRILREAAKTKVPLIHFGTGTTPFLEEFAGAGGSGGAGAAATTAGRAGVAGGCSRRASSRSCFS